MRRTTSALLAIAVLLTACDSKPAEPQAPAATESEPQQPGASSDAPPVATRTVVVGVDGMT